MGLFRSGGSRSLHDQRVMGLTPHLRAALQAAVLLGACQIAVETVLIALRTRGFILGPHGFYATQLYDFCVKLFALLPRARDLLHGGILDQFHGAGFSSKLPVALGCVVPNLAVLGLLALAVAGLQRARRRPASAWQALLLLVGCGAAIHAVSFALAVHIPDSWTLRAIARNAARVALWDGTWLSGLAFVIASGSAALPSYRRPSIPLILPLGAVTVLVALIVVAQRAPARFILPPAAPFEPGAALPPVDNLVLISIDSLRADRVGSYGNPRPTSPTLDRLAADGARFANAMSTTSWTLPAHVSMLTGRYLLSHGVITRNDRLPDAVPTLANALRAAGVSTGAVVSAPLLDSMYGFDRGFDSYDESTIPRKGLLDALRAEPAPAGTDLAVQWLRHQAGRRFFLFLHYWDVHYDYTPPAPYDRMFDPDYTGTVTGKNFYQDKSISRRMPQRDLDHLVALYDGELRWVDDHIAKVIQALAEMGIEQRTAIIVTADHGDEFFEHGWKGHLRTLYREVVHVPLIIKAPGIAPLRGAVETPVSLVDVAPTILALMGVRPPDGMDGRSLLPLMTGGGFADRPAVHAWLCHQNRHGYCKGMRHSAPGTLIHGFQPMRIEFFAPTDLRQELNLAGSPDWPRLEEIEALHANLDASWATYLQLGAEQATVQLDEATRERLRALGYGD